MYSIEKWSLGPLGTMGYVYHNGKRGLIIDPSLHPQEMLAFIEASRITVEAILLTHGHFDHYLGIFEVHDALGPLPVYIHPQGRQLLQNPIMSGAEMVGEDLAYRGETVPVAEGPFSVGDFSFEVFHIPGHSPGGVAYYAPPYLFTGDILFCGAVGRTDFRGYGDHEALISGIRKKLLSLPDDTIILPGHGGGSSIGTEKANNPFL
ncbi:MBL fold metallo-hydrolase [Chitinivibrio alkaliphilus]|uniref:Metallo-beta-lactamase superfamily protein n=1 Tax=Chitinivibrio alkaliphilus ACht1 TaxID=1313304 RepID=U7D526_9BACT|nr:MBL fold metallo-hydrolase [Chitinivibrio alkaliphilus]ERP31619.1 metallo-beta-lactamase superfamily protein [Chitinivibrio alkaliphilus ACht1]